MITFVFWCGPMGQKFNGIVMVRMPETDAERLRAIAEAHDVEAAELLRLATGAIIAFFDRHGEVPRDMAICQRTRLEWLDPDTIKQAAALAAESPATYQTGRKSHQHDSANQPPNT